MPPAPRNRHLDDPEQLKELLGIPFTPEQLAAITADLAPGVIVAGAGSGKTTVMTARVVWLVGTGAVSPDQVLGLTFTNKAAGELAERVRAALRQVGADPAGPPAAGLAGAEEEAGDPTVSTYHSFAGRLLQEHGLRIGLEPSARLLADATRFQLAARSARRAPGPFPALDASLATVAADVLALAGEMAEHLVTPERLSAFDEEFAARVGAEARPSAGARDAAAAARERRDLTRLVRAYTDAKTARDLLDFGDQIALAARLAEERPEVGEILRDTYRVVLLDEYQDTSVAQRRLLAGLFGRPEGAAHGHGHPVTAVGDPCQAIYGWRGASIDNLLSFHEHFPPAPGTGAAPRVFRLGENRRSGGRILAFANDLAADLPERRDGLVVPLRPAPGAERDGWTRCALLPTHREEIAWVADQVRHVLDTAWTEDGERLSPRDVAVLARTAADFADIHAALVARDVPVEVVGLSGLLHLPEVADLVAMCEVLDDPTANTSLVRLLAGPRWRVGPRDLALLGRRAAELVRVERAAAQTPDARLAEAVAGVDPTEVVSLSDALDDLGPGPFSAQARRRFGRLAAEIRHLRAHLGEPLMDVLHRVLTVTGLDVELSASPGALAARRRETLHLFLDTAARFADLDGDPSLTAFLAFLRTAAEHDNGLDGSLPSAGDSVKVLTAHRSKGLEWAVVAVPGLVATVFPSTRPTEKWTRKGRVLPHALRGDRTALPDLGGLAAKDFKAFDTAMKDHRHLEEVRLGYVTFTRPKNLLIASGHWWGPTQRRPRGPSEFLDRLREHCEAGNGEVAHWAAAPAQDDGPPADQAAEHAWPLPPDPEALAARRAAAAMVLGELERRRAERAAGAREAGPHEHPEQARARAGHARDDLRAGDARDHDTWGEEAPADTGAGERQAPGHHPAQDAGAGDADPEAAPWLLEPPPEEPWDGEEPWDQAEPWDGEEPWDPEGPWGPEERRDAEEPWGPEGPGDLEESRSRGDAAPARDGARDDSEQRTGDDSREDSRADSDSDAAIAAATAPGPRGPDSRDPEEPGGAAASGLTGAFPGTPRTPRARAAEPPARPLPSAGHALPHARPPYAVPPTGEDVSGADQTAGDPSAGAASSADPAADSSADRRDDQAPDGGPDAPPAGADGGAPGVPAPAPPPGEAEPVAAAARPASGAVPAPAPGAGSPEAVAGPGTARTSHAPVPAPARPATGRGPATGDDPAAAAAAALRLPPPAASLDPVDRARVRSWDADLVRLADELRRTRSGVREVDLPASLSASQMLRLAADPDGLARELVRPMPRPPAPAARRGTRFHAWVEALFGQQPLLEPDDLPGAADEDITDEADLAALQEAFLRTPYARRAPHRVEAPFRLVLGGRVVRGRIDAVYRGADGAYEVVDWKTGRAHTADPLQLAVYRLAWAETAGVDPAEVTATFLYVRTGEIVRPTGLPDRAGLERLLSGEPA